MQLVPVCQSFRFLSWLKPLSLGSSPPLPVHAAWLPESSFWNVDQILPVSGSESFSGCLFGEWNLGPPVSHSRPVIAWPESSLHLNHALPRLSAQQNYLGSLNIPSCFIPSASLLLSGWNAVPASLPSAPVSKSLHLILCPGALWKSC